MMRDRLEELRRSVEHGVERVEDLAALLEVSPSTVRRSLTELERAGQVVRTHGGAIPTLTRPERSWLEKSQEHGPAKRVIAERAAALVDDGSTILLGGGSTSTLVAERLLSREGLTVYTNGVGTLQAFQDREDIDVHVLGGRVRWRTGTMSGPETRQALRRVTVDLAFVGADGLVPGRGINTLNEELAELKEAKLRSARHRVVVADSSKIGDAPYRFWCPMDGPYTLITDDGLSTRASEDLANEAGLDLITVPNKAD